MKQEAQQREAANEIVDHHAVGRGQSLWFSHEYAPGAPFFLPSGAHIYNKLISMMRSACQEYGYQEVMSPQLLNVELFSRSGHLDHYARDMFLFDHDGRRVALKPMSCPCHCLMFSHKIRSHRNLPLRLAEFGVVHRNECSGSLSGLRRVVRFCQDDAHIFCSLDQIEQEVLNVLKLQRVIYRRLGLSFQIELASRPAKSLTATMTCGWQRRRRCAKRSAWPLVIAGLSMKVAAHFMGRKSTSRLWTLLAEHCSVRACNWTSKCLGASN